MARGVLTLLSAPLCVSRARKKRAGSKRTTTKGRQATGQPKPKTLNPKSQTPRSETQIQNSREAEAKRRMLRRATPPLPDRYTTAEVKLNVRGRAHLRTALAVYGYPPTLIPTFSRVYPALLRPLCFAREER
jgi:hypothetical protein